MKLITIGAAVVLTIVTTQVWAEMPSVSDSEFVAKASVGNTFEVAESQLALKSATYPRLKHFAEKMIVDHEAAEKQLQAAAGKTGQAVMMLDKPHQAMVDNLKTLSGTDFDKIYMADQIAAHAEAANLLADYKQNASNGELKSWAEKTLPVVKEHQAMIDAM